jgi:hypothetical protein
MSHGESYPRYWLYLNEETTAKAVFSSGEHAFRSADDELLVGANHARIVREAEDGYKETVYDSPYPPFSAAAPLKPSVRSRLSGLAERLVA